MDTTTATTLPTITLPSVDELQAWVAQQPEGSVVGLCKSSGKCMLAQYLMNTYPTLGFSVIYCPTTRHAEAAGHVIVTYWKRGVSPDDQPYGQVDVTAPALADVLDRFDNLMAWGTRITREQALTCFEENAHAETR